MIIKIICIIVLIACLFIAYYSWTIHIHKPLEYKDCKDNYCPPPKDWINSEKVEELGDKMK